MGVAPDDMGAAKDDPLADHADAGAAMNLVNATGRASPLPQPVTLLVTDITQDSRQVRAGCVFLACRGERRHGLEFAQRVAEPRRRGDPVGAGEGRAHTAAAARQRSA